MANTFVNTTFMDGFVDGPHVTVEQTGLANQGLYGPDDYVLNSGRKSEAQVLTNNSIRIFDAVYVIQGRRDVIPANGYTDVSIDNGAQGQYRHDIIVRRYQKDASSEVETTSYAVIKGTPADSASAAADPDIPTGDIRSGATLHNMKLYRVTLEGLNIVSVEPLFNILCTLSELNRKLDSKFVIKTTTLSDMAVNGGTTASKTVSVAIDGYKPLFIGYPNWMGSNSGYTLLYGCHLEDSDNLVFNMRNMGTNAASITASFPIWYIAI